MKTLFLQCGLGVALAMLLVGDRRCVSLGGSRCCGCIVRYTTIWLQAVFGARLLLFGCAGLRVECVRCLCGGRRAPLARGQCPIL
jgi:hypothetical protein